MRLKEYQLKVLERLDTYLAVLKCRKTDAEEYAEFQRTKGRAAELSNYPEAAWDELKNTRLLPTMRDQRGNEAFANHKSRWDGLHRPIPNICFKVPTAGGKTLLAVNALERLNINFFERQTGFVLWIVPSDSIYRQTWRALANREHPYRQVLERASGGKVRLLTKADSFSPTDVREYLCVMLLMLQGAARRSSDSLKVFRDSGSFSSFFPEVDDFSRNEALLNSVPNLDVNEIGTPSFWNGISLKHSLGNTLRLLRPIIFVDEGHRAYTETARSTLTGFNPSFLLELSATPNMRERHSNVLVDVPGTALKEEQMIKLPINIYNFDKSGWKPTLTKAVEHLKELSNDALHEQAQSGRYIRPLMLIRVERTGREQRDGIHIHARDARDFLINNLGVPPEEIRIKSATVDELGDENLLSQLCKVRFIITKDALKEGWDCPFAYILTLLSKTTAPLAMTQMMGRVLRQPEVTLTTIERLNECYIYCFDQDVNQAIESVRKGMEEEGMTGLRSEVKVKALEERETTKVEIRRRKTYQGLRIFLPRVIHKSGENYRPLDYDSDILAALDWNSLSYSGSFSADDRDALMKTVTTVDLNAVTARQQLDVRTTRESTEVDQALDVSFLVRQLMEVVPNPWQAIRILNDCFSRLRKAGANDEQIIRTRLHLLQLIKQDLQKQVNCLAEEIFRAKLLNKDIIFQLFSSRELELNWEIAESYFMTLSDDNRVLSQRDGSPISKSLFDRAFESDFNSLEKQVALYVDGGAAVQWWHRLIAKNDWHLQGWQKNKVYPDFLICLKSTTDGKQQALVLETKGAHLKGNDDTLYKQELFKVLENVFANCIDAGEMDVIALNSNHMIFRLLLDDTWRASLAITV